MGIIIIQIILGIFAFFLFLAGISNGHTQYALLIAVVGLLLTSAISYRTGRRSLPAGFKAALGFSSPALLFSLLALGDALQGKLDPLLFWSGAGVVSLLAGLAGVALARRFDPA